MVPGNRGAFVLSRNRLNLFRAVERSTSLHSTCQLRLLFRILFSVYCDVFVKQLVGIPDSSMRHLDSPINELHFCVFFRPVYAPNHLLRV